MTFLSVVASLADVVGHAPLERLETLEQLVRLDRLLGLARPDQPWRRLDRGVPRDLVGVGALAVGLAALGRRRDRVEVDVVEAATVLLVELDPGAPAAEARRLGADRRPEGRVLAPIGVAQHVARRARARARLDDVLHEDLRLHGGACTRLGSG